MQSASSPSSAAGSQAASSAKDDSVLLRASAPSAEPPGSPAINLDSGDSATISAAAHRKRKTGHGGRGVANLTPEQLAKKRANDREAQRNIRERTKAQIETLEHTIEQLRSQQPYQELQRVIREKEALESELADLKRMLATVLSLIQPHVASTLDSRTGHSELSVAGHHHNLTPTSVPRAGFHHDQFMPHVDVNATPLSVASTTYSMPWQTHGSDSPASQSQPPAFAPRPRSPNGQPTLLGMASSIYRMTESEQEALTQFRLDGPREASRNSSSGPVPGYMLPEANGLDTIPFDENAPNWTLTPRTTKATCTLDTICLTFRSDVEKRIREGAPPDQVIGGTQPDWQFIANPDSGQEHLVGALSRFFGQVLSNRMFPDLQKPAEKVGTAYLLYTFAYWQITRRKEDFERIPEWLRPVRAQLAIPHGPWVDAMFWPEMRDLVIKYPHEYVFDELFVPLTRTARCNWPYGDKGIFDTTSDPIRLSDQFLQHILRFENWTLGSEFARAYPKLKGTFNLRADDT